MKTLRTLFYMLFGLLALVASALTAIYFIAKAVLAPLPGEWAVPLRAGPLQLQAGVPTMLRLATASWAGPLLHGRSVATRAGPVQLAWQAPGQTLVLRCAPCRVPVPGLDGAPVVLDELRLSVRRQGGQLSGEVSAGKVAAAWRGTLSQGGLQLALQLPMTPISDAYALFQASIPEVRRARIDGQVALTAAWRLPGGALQATPRLEGFQVSGLGTEAWAGARSACRAGGSRLDKASWLARAVVAAEDQRFYTHPGYDLAELRAVLGQHESHDQPMRRGASTLSQQLAKLLVTGDERSPARKLRELLYAVEMEQTLGKARILQLYLAHAPWGQGLCGAESASRFYFGRPAHALTPLQAAWLAAMLHNPDREARRWSHSGQINVARTRWVLESMRPMPARRRLRLLEELGHAAWPPPVPASP